MIKFFRKIRQKLLKENNIAKYLLYAIGEIVLVVIGILIALQINNWNESKQALTIELGLYKTILDNVNDEYLNTNWHIRNVKSYQDVHYHLYKETQGKAQYNSNIYYNTLQWIHPFNPIIHENYSVSLVDINNEKIREYLNSNISAENRAIDAFEEWNDFKVEHLRPFFSKNGIHNTSGAFNDKPYDFMSLLGVDLLEHTKLTQQFGTVELDELLFDLRFKTAWLIENLNILEETNRALADALKNELELNNVSIGKHQAYNLEFITEAEKLYDLKAYQQSANKYKEAFDQIEGKAFPNDRYNAACSYALAEDIETAFYHLFRLAKDSGYKNYEQIITDTDLYNLHKDPRWNELIAIEKLNKEEAENSK